MDAVERQQVYRRIRYRTGISQLTRYVTWAGVLSAHLIVLLYAGYGEGGGPVVQAATMAGVATSLFGPTAYGYVTARKGQRRREQLVEHGEPVDAEVLDVHVIQHSKWAQLYGIRYLPVVEFAYHWDGERRVGNFIYPDGVHEPIAGRATAESEAQSIAENHDETAYYVPQADQAFLRADPHSAVLGHQYRVLIALIGLAVAGSALVAWLLSAL